MIKMLFIVLLLIVYFAVVFYFLYALVSGLFSNQPSEKATKKQIIFWSLLSFLWPLALAVAIIDHLLNEGIE